MRALILIVAFAAVLTVPATGQTKEQQVAVAIAIAKAKSANTHDAESCGVCREDEKQARADSLAGGKPLVVFVGACTAYGKPIVEAGGIPLRVTEYLNDATPRVVVLEPKPDKSGFWIAAEGLKPEDTPAAVKKLLAPKPAPAPVVVPKLSPLNWS